MKRTALQRKTPLRATPNPSLTVKPKARKCAVKTCRSPFTTFSTFQTWCSPDCGTVIALAKVEKGKALAAKRARQADRARREKLKTRSDYLKEAQVAFNAFIRARDAGKPCICCGKPLADVAATLTGGGYDCGHYRSTGSAPHLRFDERNAHAQRKVCNQHGAGRAVDYRIGLIARIGLEAVEALEADQTPRKWTIDELKAIRATYKTKLKELKGARDA